MEEKTENPTSKIFESDDEGEEEKNRTTHVDLGVTPIDKLPISPPLKVITREEKKKRVEEIRESNKDGRAKTAVKVVTRAVGYNFDIVIILIFGFVCGWLGYVFCQAFGQQNIVTSKTIAETATNYLELIGIIITAIVIMLAKLAANRGLISERLNEALYNFLKETFKPKGQIDPITNVSIVQDRKIYQGDKNV